MKNIILFIILSSQFLFGQNDQFTLRVEGLGCPFCAYGLEKKIQKSKRNPTNKNRYSVWKNDLQCSNKQCNDIE